jgi:hypothetical protein
MSRMKRSVSILCLLTVGLPAFAGHGLHALPGWRHGTCCGFGSGAPQAIWQGGADGCTPHRSACGSCSCDGPQHASDQVAAARSRGNPVEGDPGAGTTSASGPGPSLDASHPGGGCPLCEFLSLLRCDPPSAGAVVATHPLPLQVATIAVRAPVRRAEAAPARAPPVREPRNAA